MNSDLEDRVRQRLGRPVVDLLGEPRALGLLRLDDPHREVAVGIGRVARCDERGIAALQEQPGPRQGSLGELELGQLEPGGRSSSAARGSTSPRSAATPGVARRRPRPSSAASASSAFVDDEARTRSRGLAVDAVRARRAAPASGRASSSVGLAVALAHARAACSRCSRPPRWPPRGARRSGCPPVDAACSLHRLRSIRAAHGQTIS